LTGKEGEGVAGVPPATVPTSFGNQVGLYLTGQLLTEPKFYPGGPDAKTGQIKPPSMQVGLFFGQPQSTVMYVPPEWVAGRHAGEVITIGPLRVSKTGGLYSAAS
jgi:hypothetical protein